MMTDKNEKQEPSDADKAQPASTSTPPQVQMDEMQQATPSPDTGQGGHGMTNDEAPISQMHRPDATDKEKS